MPQPCRPAVINLNQKEKNKSIKKIKFFMPSDNERRRKEQTAWRRVVEVDLRAMSQKMQAPVIPAIILP